ncbi:hypothetical protein [Belnapia arida]|nr:hypothetical protein [Belnapia arida]
MASPLAAGWKIAEEETEVRILQFQSLRAGSHRRGPDPAMAGR